MAPAALTETHFDVDKQKAMCKEIAEMIGFDFDKGNVFIRIRITIVYGYSQYDNIMHIYVRMKFPLKL